MEDLSKRSHLLNRNGHYYLRVRVPVDLVDHLKKAEIKLSLKTKDLKEAKVRLQVELLKIEQDFQKLRRKLSEPATNNPSIRSQKPRRKLSEPATSNPSIKSQTHLVTKTELERAVLLWHKKVSEQSAKEADQFRINLSLDDEETILNNLYEELTLYRAPDPFASERLIYYSATQVLEQAGISRDAINKELYQYLYNLIQQASIEQCFDSLERYGQFPKRIPSSLFSKTNTLISSREEGLTNEITLSELLTKFRAAKKSDGLTDKSLAGYKLTFDFLLELFGKDKLIKSFTSADCREFRDKLSQLPSNAKKKYPHLSLMQALEKRAKDNTEALSITSVNGHMKNLLSIFNFSVRERLLDSNPASHVPLLKAKRSNSKKRVPFTYEELQKVFSTPIYSGCKDDEHGYNIIGTNKPRRHRFWIPLIALYTGMRLNEICQLFVNDIDVVEGIQVIHVRIDEEGIKTLKNDNSERIVPIHKSLIELGFLDYVKSIKEQNHKQLFPELGVSARHSFSDNFSKWFSRFLTTSNLKRPGLCFHSFRHTFRDECRVHDINKEIAATLGGWKFSDDAMDRYGKGYDLKILQTEINKIHINLKLTL